MGYDERPVTVIVVGVVGVLVAAALLYWLLYVRNAPSPKPIDGNVSPPPPAPPPTPPVVAPPPSPGIFPPTVPPVDPTARVGRWVRIDRAAAGYLSVAAIAALRPGSNPAKIPVKATAMTMPPYNASMGPERVADDDPKTFAHTKNPAATNTFIEIDLGADTPVGVITVGNRADCCQDRLLGASVSLLNAARQTVWSRPFLTVGPIYTFSMAGPAVRTPPVIAFTLDASAAGSLFADADGRTPAVATGKVRHWRATNGQALTLSRDATWNPDPVGGSLPLVALGGAEGTYAVPTVDATVDARSDTGATLVVVCAMPTNNATAGHPWSAATPAGVSAFPASNGAIHETFYASNRTAWVPSAAETRDRLVVYAVVADPVSGLTSSFLDSTVVRVRAGYRRGGADPARLTAWTGVLAEMRVYRGALGVGELDAVMAELKAKWNWRPVSGPQSFSHGVYGRSPWGTAAKFAAPSAHWIFGPGSSPWSLHRHTRVVTAAAAHDAVLHVLAEDTAVVAHNGTVIGTTGRNGWLSPDYPRFGVRLTAGRNVFSFDVETSNGRTNGKGLCAALLHAATGAVVMQTDGTSGWAWSRHTGTVPWILPVPPPGGYVTQGVHVLGPYDLAPWNAAAFPVPTAAWIWSSASAQKSAPSGATFVFFGSFAAAAAGTAIVHARADDAATLYVNGSMLGTNASLTPGRWRVSVRAGPNTVTVVAANARPGPAGLLLGIVSESSEPIVLGKTDASWRFARY